jgi:hypothetical protein
MFWKKLKRKRLMNYYYYLVGCNMDFVFFLNFYLELINSMETTKRNQIFIANI